jgi:AraC family transcriptional regulator, arabinose operon regulatory protein
MPRDAALPNAGFKRFFSPEPLGSRELAVRGIGIRERMQPCLVDRPKGTGDYLCMLFHDAAFIGTIKTEPEASNSVMIWPPGKGQFYGHSTQRFNHSWIHCEGSRIRIIIRQAGVPVLRPFHIADSSRFEQCLLEIHGEIVSYAQPDMVTIGNLLENGLRSLTRTRPELSNGVRVPEGLLAVRRLIGTAPSRSLTLPEMAATAGMSVPYFCSCFKQTFDVSPIECLIQHRMHHASRLLANENLTITEIANEVGYEDLFHFSKMFKKHFGFSPRAMRKRK